MPWHFNTHCNRRIRRAFRYFLGAGVLLLYLMPSLVSGAQDPWKTLREAAGRQEVAVRKPSKAAPTDPWRQLRTIVMSFSEDLDTNALTDPDAAREVAAHLHRRLAPYAAIIREASDRFSVPQAVIGAVIMVESGGDPRARATTSSAKGLMQTIDGTFQDARSGLKGLGIHIENNPYSPRASILAGAWYLNQMFISVVRDTPGVKMNRWNIEAWRTPLEYYYAGPGHGKKREDIIIVYADGRKLVIDKPKYSRKVLEWATMMAG